MIGTLISSWGTDEFMQTLLTETIWPDLAADLQAKTGERDRAGEERANFGGDE